MSRVVCVVLCCCLLAAIPGGARAEEPKYTRSIERFQIPDVTLVNQDGERVRLKPFLESDEVALVDFIYATCTTICPVLSAGFASFQKKLAAESKTPRLASISIDPDHDTPAVMKEYLQRYRAGKGWSFLTGSRADIDAVLRAMNAYIPNKMAHFPLVEMRSPADGSWVRLYGLMGTKDLLEEYRNVPVR
jgi:protein SCO1/2